MEVLAVVVSVLCACESSADIERMFSSHGVFIQISETDRKIKNQLHKLAFILKHYNT